MIVDPDFFNHWKSLTLVTKLGDERALLSVLRLWAHCHSRRNDTFPLTPSKLAAICQWKGDAEKLFEAMVDDEEGFLNRNADDDDYTVHDWWKTNRAITSKWGNSNARKDLNSRDENESKSNRKQVENNSLSSLPISSLPEGESERKNQLHLKAPDRSGDYRLLC